MSALGKLFEVDELRVFRGRDLQIAPKLRIRQPTLGEIEGGDSGDGEESEKRFFSVVHTILATPTDLMAQLDEKGLRYEEISNYQLFMLLFPQIEKRDAAFLFGEGLDPADFIPTEVDNQPGRVVLGNAKDEIVIDEIGYRAIVNYICKFMNMEQTRFIKNGNEFTRMVRMELAYEEWEEAKRKPFSSPLKTLISTMTNMEGFKYGWYDVWDMKIGAFMDAVSRIQTIVSARALLNGCYSGNIDVSKIDKSQLNYMKKLA